MKQLKGGKGGGQRPKYRLSPNEVEQLKKEETERRRKLRIVQVREQSKAAAAAIRQNVKQEKKRQLLKLANEIEDELEKEKEEEVRKLEQHYDNTLRTIGQGHSQAMLTEKKTCNADQRIAAYQSQEKAEKRHKEALRKLALDKAYAEYEETKHLRDRQAALVEEKKRALEVASRPPPPPDPLNEALLIKTQQKRPVPLTDVNAFSSTHYHMPEIAVEKAPTEQQLDGKVAGDEEDLRTKEEITERRKKEHDQIVRARIRGNEALKKEKLKHEFDSLMADLSLQQRMDRRQRQLVVAKLPKQVFIPADRRMEELDDRQMEMERAFEDMYTQQLNLSGDLSLTFDPKPSGETPADTSQGEGEGGQSPVVIPTMPPFNPALRELTNVSRGQEGKATPQQGMPETALKKLLNKIKEQRSEQEQQETSMHVTPGRENIVSEKEQEANKAARPDFSKSRAMTSKPSADPDLDLSPQKVKGNQKPLKGRGDMDQEEEEGGQEESEALTDGHEAGFLQRLQHRLQAIEVQKDHLDKMMKERQHQQHQYQPQNQQQHQTWFPTDSRPQQPSTVPQRPALFPSTSSGPHASSQQVSGSFSTAQSTLTPSGGPAGDVGIHTNFGAKKADGGDFSAFRHGTAELNRPALRPLGGLSSQNALPGVQPGSRMGQGGSGLVDSSAAAPLRGFVSVDQFGASSGLSAMGTSSFSSASSSVQPAPTAVASAPVVSFAAPISLSSAPAPATRGGTLTTGGAFSTTSLGGSAFPTIGAASLGGAGFGVQTTGNLPASDVISQIYNRAVSALSFSHPPANLGPTQLQPASLASSLINRPLLSQSQSQGGSAEEERLRKLREYQQQLIAKHQERMQALQDVRTSIQARQEGNKTTWSVSSSMSMDPASLVPYTLRTSLLPQESSLSTTTGSSSSGFNPLPAVSGPMPFSAGFNALPARGGLDANRLSGSGVQTSGGVLGADGFAGLQNQGAESSVPREAAASLSRETSRVLAAAEPILAGSSGILSSGPAPAVSQTVRPASLSSVAPPTTVIPDWGDRALPTSAAVTSSSAPNRLDSVRKSLPFDQMDDTLPGQQDEEGGETDGGVSLADDSQLSSSTERGSPALPGSRSNKSSTSGKSGSGSSALSDGSLGGSSLVARAEETRLGFEQRQKELQNQLAEIQRQKDALLQRYHGNQMRVSAQEESLRSKLRTAKEPSSVPGSLSHYPSAVSLGVHQSSSPSTELEERSISASERVSGVRSWASELEEFSLSKSGGGEGAGGGVFKSPATTLEEVSILSDRSIGGRDASKASDRSANNNNTRPGSVLSSLEEYSIISGRLSAEGMEGISPPVARGNQGIPPTFSDSARLSRPDDAVKGLDLMQELGVAGETVKERGGAFSTWSKVFFSDQPSLQEEAESQLLAAPKQQSIMPQPQGAADFEPHELSTILEVDTPQTATRNAAFPRTSPRNRDSGTDKPASRRFIDFAPRHGTTTGAEEDRDKFSASTSSASSDVRSVIEVRTGVLKSGETAMSAGGGVTGEETSFEKRFRENVLEASTMKAAVPALQGLNLPPSTSQEASFRRSQEASYSSGSQGFQSMELTLDSLTPRSVSVEDSQARRYLDFSGREDGGGEREGGGERADDVLRQARQFNRDLMSAIQRQSAEVFDQSSQSSISQTAAFGAAAAEDQSQSSLHSAQSQGQQ